MHFIKLHLKQKQKHLKEYIKVNAELN